MELQPLRRTGTVHQGAGDIHFDQEPVDGLVQQPLDVGLLADRRKDLAGVLREYRDSFTAVGIVCGFTEDEAENIMKKVSAFLDSQKISP